MLIHKERQAIENSLFEHTEAGDLKYSVNLFISSLLHLQESFGLARGFQIIHGKKINNGEE